MAIPHLSAVSMTCSSRIDPPDWITAVVPACAAVINPSEKGKNASEPTTLSSRVKPAFLAFIRANFVLSMRDICPAPIPRVRSALAYTIALDLTWLTTRQANNNASHSLLEGWRLVTTLHCSAVIVRLS